MAVTIFNPSNVFATLSTVPFAETSPLARALRSVIVEPAGLSQFNTIQDIQFPGFTSDIPGIQTKPIQLALDNILLLSSLRSELQVRLQETSASLQQVRDTLEEAIRNEDRNLLNRADDILESSLLAQAIAAAQEMNILEDTGSRLVASPVFLDFTFRPNENAVFSDTFSALSREIGVTSTFIKGVSLASGDSITLDQLLLGSASANGSLNGNQFALSLSGELGGDSIADVTGALGSLRDGDFSIIDFDDLANYTLTAGDGGLGSLDYLSIVEIGVAGRGAYQTVAINSSTDAELGAGGANGAEPFKTFDFYTESGTAYTQIRLQFDNFVSGTYTDALDAIQNNALRVKVGETLLDGSINIGQVDRSQSSGNTIVVVFPFQAAEDGLAQNGLDVEIREIGTDADITNVTVRAEFP